MTVVRGYKKRAWIVKIPTTDKLGTGANDPTVVDWMTTRNLKVGTTAATVAGNDLYVDSSTEGTLTFKAPTGGTYADKSYTGSSVTRISQVMIRITPEMATDELDLTTQESDVKQLYPGRSEFRINTAVFNSDDAKDLANADTADNYFLYIKELDPNSTKRNLYAAVRPLPQGFEEEDTGRSVFNIQWLNIGNAKPQWQADA